MRPHPLAALAVATTMVTACDAIVGLSSPSDDSSGNDGMACSDPDASPAAFTNVRGFFEELRTNICQRLAGCGMTDYDRDQAACEQTVDYLLAPRRAALYAAEDEGVVAIDPCEATLCEASWAPFPSCDPSTSFAVAGQPPGVDPYEPFGTTAASRATVLRDMVSFAGGACGRTIVGYRAMGSTCHDPLECVRGATCTTQTGAPSSLDVPGVCGEIVGVGGACASDVGCTTGEGDPCGDGSPDVAAIDLSCGEGLVCDPANMCRRAGVLALGAACTPGFDVACAPGLYCDPASAKCATRLATGSACNAEFACPDGMWCVGLTTTSGGTCAGTYSGAPCTGGSENVALGSDGCLALVDHCVNGTCIPFGDVGACGGDDCPVIPYSTCQETTATQCMPVGSGGAPCGTASDCASLVCESGVCADDVVTQTLDAGIDADTPASLFGTVNAPSAIIKTTAGQETMAVSGNFFFSLAPGQPFTLTAAAPGFWTLFEQQLVMGSGSTGSLALTLVSSSYAASIVDALPGFDSTLGMAAITITAETSCAYYGLVGSTIDITGAGPDASTFLVAYTTSGAPSSASSVTSSTTPSAYAYNLPVGVDLTVSVTSPACHQDAYPVDQSEITYAGPFQVAAGSVSSYVVAFLR